MKKKRNNKGFALAEILAVTLVLMIIFTVLYSNFMPLSGEYVRAESYNDISSQYELHYFRKLFKSYSQDENTLGNENYIVLLSNEINECSTSSNEAVCNSLKDELNPTLILTKYNLLELKNYIKQNTYQQDDENKKEALDELKNYILSLPDYADRDGEEEVYRLIIKTNTGYGTVKLYYNSVEIVPILNIPVGTNGVEKVTHKVDSTLQVDDRFSNEYRYQGSNEIVKNYVVFNNEVWRIIGIIPTEDNFGNIEYRMKIVKNNSNIYQRWNNKGSSDWTTATLNTYLNSTYYDTLDSTSKSMVGTVKYYLGGCVVYPEVDQMWQVERKKANSRNFYGDNKESQLSEEQKIAIMYVSDYGYGVSSDCESKIVHYSSDVACITANNWLYSSKSEWMLTNWALVSGRTFYLNYAGDIRTVGVSYMPLYARPTLTLSSETKISGGLGTSSDPYTLSL